MIKIPQNRTCVYVLTETHMQKLDELISELQCVYCDIYSNRQLSITSGLQETPASGLVNALIENNVTVEDVF